MYKLVYVKASEVAEKLKMAAKTADEVEKNRDIYRPVAKRGAILFFILAEMASINSMYQYALSAYVEVPIIIVYFIYLAYSSFIFIGAGTIFRLGEQKLNEFSFGKQKLVKNNQDNQIQSLTLCNMYFSKKAIRSVQWGLGQSPRSWGIFENLCVKGNLKVCKVTFNCLIYMKKMGSRIY